VGLSRPAYVDAEERQEDLYELNEMDGPVFKIRDAPRITPVGRVLRRWNREYIDSWTLGEDLVILSKTIPAVLRGTGGS